LFDPGDWRLQYSITTQPTLDRLARGSFASKWPAVARSRIVRAVPPFQRRAADRGERNLAFIRAALDLAGREIFVDSTKNPERIRFLHGLDLDLRVIHLIRDPRGYCNSCRTRPRLGWPVEKGARSWLRRNRAA